MSPFLVDMKMQNEIETERDSGQSALKPTRFYCAAPRASRVEIAGDFNQWQPLSMQRTADGWWRTDVKLEPGCHLYRFLVDGRPMLDPQSSGISRDENGERVSLVAVI
jgi:1,4-alpha-glucan branching enzyme